MQSKTIYNKNKTKTKTKTKTKQKKFFCPILHDDSRASSPTSEIIDIYITFLSRYI